MLIFVFPFAFVDLCDCIKNIYNFYGVVSWSIGRALQIVDELLILVNNFGCLNWVLIGLRGNQGSYREMASMESTN